VCVCADAVDKYGRRGRAARGSDSLRRFYRMDTDARQGRPTNEGEGEGEGEEEDEYDPARGVGVSASSSDTEDEPQARALFTCQPTPPSTAMKRSVYVGA
jgi:hypothetical protein